MAKKKEDTQVISVRLDETEQIWLREYADDEDLSVSQVIRRALKLYKKEVVDKKEKL